ncbi:hypothetical protein [Granulosicoccus antarcticus]|uniref:NHL repeat containing protein n=1 Tax=Granulosicoccus antarcticus IMCC3135 TaxID=1192854 RepID=A0A2Z2NJV4_9GAMM|nr:hypothetical protein [Granulosicoccus antarcticus]ASJ70785.1 hypothetical protein IMCC3135_03360 [Granulosicoccus antarcticus IMCC3135]
MTFKRTDNSTTSLITLNQRPTLWARRPLFLAVAMALTLSACSDNDDDSSNMDTDTGNTDMSIPTGRFAIAMNDGQSAGSVSVFSPDLATMSQTLATGANQGLSATSDGTLYQNADTAGSEGIRAINRAAYRADMDSFGANDRIIGSTAGKGLFALPAMGLLASCDITDDQADLKFFSTTAGEQAQAVSSINLPASCWDGFHSESEDKLYLALTNGTLAVIDDVSQLDLTGSVTLGEDAISRLITVIGDDGVQQSINFHGVSAENGTVLVSDIGSADSASDGALYVFSDDGTLDGEVTATPIAGPATLLGNPVDVVLLDGNAIVAEKSNDAILVFNGVSELSGDIAPSYQMAFTKPESIVSLGMNETIQDTSDIVSGDSVSRLLVSQNPGPQQDTGTGADNDNVGRIAVIEEPSVTGVADTGLAISVASVTGDPGQQSFRTLENIQLDSSGNGYVVFDITDGTTVTDKGILAINGAANRDNTDNNSNNYDRVIGGANSGLTSPKGIEVVGEQGALIISDTGSDSVAASLVVLSTNAGSDAMPMFTVMDTGDATIWDTDYDAANDRLYAAGTGGDVLVYDNFFAMGASATPTRSFRIAADGVTSNIHGIVHDEATDTVMATDVGDAASATDGSFYIIDTASTATGVVTPVATIAGPLSMLGNPVDIAFDGSSVYIAEKSNDRVLVYRNVSALQGTMDQAADESIAISKPESVALQLQ